MTFDWQTMIAIGIVLGAATVLVRQARRLFRAPHQSGCSGCPSNSQATRVKNLPLVELKNHQRSP